MKNKVIVSASIVTGLSVAERFLGFLYRIVLSRLLGAEGLGIYQIALSLFGLFAVVGSGGIPVTVSRIISKSKAEQDERGEHRAVSAGITACLLLTLPFCLLLGVFGGKIPFLFSDGRAFPVFRILLLGLAFSSVYAVIRGYFWGNKEFLTPSVLEIAEESVMVIAGIFLLRRVPSPLVGAKKAAWAVVISYLFSFTASLLCFFFKGGKTASPKQTLKPLFSSAMPITAVRASGSLVNSAVAILLPVMLMRAGADHSTAMKLFGVVSGMVLPVLFIPSTIIGSIALVLIPELSEDFYRKNNERLQLNLERGLRFSLLVACVLIPFFYALGTDVGRLAFSNAAAGVMLRKSCLILLPMSLTMISTSMLNAMGFEKQTFAYFFFGAAALLLCIFILPKFCGAYAYIIGLGASYTVTAACNLFCLRKKLPFFKNDGVRHRDYALFIPLFAILPFSALGRLCNRVCKLYFGELFSVFATAIVLALAIFLLYTALGYIPFKKLRLLRKTKKTQKSGN